MTTKADRLLAWRRHLHTIPEPGFGEFQTVAYLLGELEAIGARVRFGSDAQDASLIMSRDVEAVVQAHDEAVAAGVDPDLVACLDAEGTGIVAEVGEGQPVIAVRVDMDALPVTEAEDGHLPARKGFRSTRNGWMHACGHDGHMSLGLGILAAAAARPLGSAGTLRVLFQPAEEGTRGGAAAMVARGVVDDADHMLAIHIGLGVPAGDVAPSARFMATTKLRAVITGVGAHVTNNPEAGANALLAAAAAALGIHSIAPSSRGWFSTNVGILRAGREQGIVPEKAVLELGFWAENDEVHDYVAAEVARILEHSAASRRCLLLVERIGAAPSVPGSPDLVARICATARGVHVPTDNFLVRAGEDGSEFMKRVQANGGDAAFVLLGSTIVGGHHTPAFDFDEADLVRGLEVLTDVTADLLRG